jgi:hypothetical protein
MKKWQILEVWFFVARLNGSMPSGSWLPQSNRRSGPVRIKLSFGIAFFVTQE